MYILHKNFTVTQFIWLNKGMSGAVAVDHDTYWVNIMSSEVAQLQGSLAKTTPSDAQKLSSSGCYIMFSICVFSLFIFFAQ
ncbi:hypothetical protein EB796_012315 [Bugula neritina]|uniref:Uncharacterized protein n=1 Tax=Bugula neritina TaxID=10212 RepID=A0A7J7JTP5_BUGNE|nr:hypothetical protein EB796_012315 [Bugula neritina]